MGLKVIGTLIVLSLVGCHGASLERPPGAFAVDDHIQDGYPKFESHGYNGAISVVNTVIAADQVQITPESGSSLRQTSNRKLLIPYGQHARRLQQLMGWLVPQNNPYSARSGDGNTYAGLGAQPGQPAATNTLWPLGTWWQTPNNVDNAPVQGAAPAVSPSTATTAPASTQTVAPGKSSRNRQRQPRTSQAQPRRQQTVQSLQQQANRTAQQEQRQQLQEVQPTVPTTTVPAPAVQEPAAQQAIQPAGLRTGQDAQARRRRRNVPAASPAVAAVAVPANPAAVEPAATPVPAPVEPPAQTVQPPAADIARLLPPATAAAAAGATAAAVTPVSVAAVQQPSASPAAATQTRNCISATRGMQFNVLAAGDSITQGSVPSKGYNHPYTIRLKDLLRSKLGKNADATDAGLGGGGIFMEGFNNPVRFAPYYQSYLNQVEWNVAVIAIGINDLLRGGYSANDIMGGLQPLYEQTLAKGIPVVAIPPFAAPGFVSQTDPKEAERRKLATLITEAAGTRKSATGGNGPQIYVLDLQAGPLDFYKMSDSDRSRYLDDGLHMTEMAYDLIGQYVFETVNALLCSVENPTITLPDPKPLP